MREAERKRLVRLIRDGDRAFSDKYTGEVMSHIDELYEFIADYLLDNGVIVPPCKVGDVVYYLHEICDEDDEEYLDIIDGECASISKQKEALWVYCRYENGLTYWHKVDEIGKSIFFSEAEAEYALKNRRSVSLVDGHIEE